MKVTFRSCSVGSRHKRHDAPGRPVHPHRTARHPAPPPADVFSLFDDLLLLQRGGYEAYFGPLGRHGRAVVRYLEAVPGVPHCPRGTNPATWMLKALHRLDESAALAAEAAVAARHGEGGDAKAGGGAKADVGAAAERGEASGGAGGSGFAVRGVVG